MTFDACFITILPLADNAGVPLDAEIDAVLLKIVSRFGGFTLEEVSGAWRSPSGVVHRDESKRVTVLCTSKDRGEARALVSDAGRSLRQEAMFFEWRHPLDAETVGTN